jgi:hypothetical protein
MAIFLSSGDSSSVLDPKDFCTDSDPWICI